MLSDMEVLMDLRHLRCFVALAEELHFGRAAERVHMEQSPLSRTIRELEDRLGVRLFDRNRRGTSLTQAGRAFHQEVHRIFNTLEQAKQVAQAAAAGHTGALRLAVSDDVAQPRLAALLALSRVEDPSVEILLMEVPLTEQLRGLRDGTFDAGFSRCQKSTQGIRSYPLWKEDLVVVIPSRHPLLSFPNIPLGELIKYPMIVSHPNLCEGYSHQINRVLRKADIRPNIIERTASLEMTLTMVAAGYGVGFAPAEKIAVYRYPEVAVRPLDTDSAELTTYLLAKSEAETSERLDTFINRATRTSGSADWPSPPLA
jgi:DNA-binding transcriptional LysR family regulator